MSAIRRTAARISAVAAAAILLPAATVAQDVAAETAPRQVEVEILGMSCPFCAYGVEQKLEDLAGVENLEVELQTGIATLTLVEGADVSNETLENTIREAGFETAAIRRNFESEYPDVEKSGHG